MRNHIIATLTAITLIMMVYSCQNHQELELAKYMSGGRDLYLAHCQNCHGEKGEGLGELAPPLTDTVFLEENKHKLAGIIKNGMDQPILVHGKSYEGKMPGFPNLQTIDIVQIIVYTTNSFGNNQGMYTYEQAARDLKNH